MRVGFLLVLWDACGVVPRLRRTAIRCRNERKKSIGPEKRLLRARDRKRHSKHNGESADNARIDPNRVFKLI